MKGNKRFLGVSLCILLLLVLFVFPWNVGAAEVSDPQTTDVYEVGIASGQHGVSDAWAEESEEEYKESEDQEQSGEEVTEEEGWEQESAPSDPEDESSTPWPSDEESLPLTPQGDDDLVQSSEEE
jgi:hypothetical protein